MNSWVDHLLRLLGSGWGVSDTAPPPHPGAKCHFRDGDTEAGGHGLRCGHVCFLLRPPPPRGSPGHTRRSPWRGAGGSARGGGGSWDTCVFPQSWFSEWPAPWAGEGGGGHPPHRETGVCGRRAHAPPWLHFCFREAGAFLRCWHLCFQVRVSPFLSVGRSRGVLGSPLLRFQR